MSTNNDAILLREAEVEPTDIVLENALGKELFVTYQEVIGVLTNEFGLEPQLSNEFVYVLQLCDSSIVHEHKLVNSFFPCS